MKKLLSVLAAVGVVASSTVSVVACGTKSEKKPEQPKDELTEVIQDFEKDVTKIWLEHYEKEVVSNLITLEDVNNDYEFLVKSNIQYYSNSVNRDKLTVEEKKQLTSDVEKMFKVKLLKEKLNELKKLNKYKVILDEVDSVFEHLELLFNDKFEINSGELSKGVYIGNVIVDYKVVTHYKGKVDVEKFSQLGTLKYTSTESKAFKDFGDVMYKNIAKDMFISQEAKEYVNLKWSDIKGSKEDYEAYVNSNVQLKKYYDKNKGFQKALLKTINDKYFKPQFPNLEIAYSKESIYKSDNFLVENKEYLIMNNLDKENAIKLKEGQDTETISKILLADEKVITRVLKNDVFNLLTLEKNKKKYGVAQDKFLNGFLDKAEVVEYQKTKYYGFGVAMGYADFVGPIIKIGNNDFAYDHQLPDFKLAISYSMNGEDNLVTNKAFIDLSLKLFGVYKDLWAPKVVDNERYLFKMNYSKRDSIWKDGPHNWAERSVKEVKSVFQNYKQFYFKELERRLSLLGMTGNVFASSNILYLLNTDKADDFKIADIWWGPGIENGGYFMLGDSSSESNYFFKNINCLTFSLFGIVEMDIYFKTIYSGNKIIF